VWDRVQDPRDIVLEDGTVQETEQDDFRIIFGLGWDF
jgi:hypothetical protein